jgi:regulator of sigma D
MTAEGTNNSQNYSASRRGGGEDRRDRIQRTTKQLVEERQSVMVAYWDLAKKESAGDRAAIRKKLQAFCQILMDYTAFGHFEVYQRIVEGKERRQNVRRLAAKVYRVIAETTDVLVDFNDKYDHVHLDDALGQLPDDLSKLGESFAARIELEDQILDALNQPRMH